MTNSTWSDADVSAAAGRVRGRVSRTIRSRRRARRIGFAAGLAVVGAAGIAAASTALPPQMPGEIGAGSGYAPRIVRCLAADGWNVWAGPHSDGMGPGDSVFFSVSGYEEPRFMDQVDACRLEVAHADGVTFDHVIGYDANGPTVGK